MYAKAAVFSLLTRRLSIRIWRLAGVPLLFFSLVVPSFEFCADPTTTPNTTVTITRTKTNKVMLGSLENFTCAWYEMFLFRKCLSFEISLPNVAKINYILTKRITASSGARRLDSRQLFKTNFQKLFLTASLRWPPFGLSKKFWKGALKRPLLAPEKAVILAKISFTRKIVIYIELAGTLEKRHLMWECPATPENLMPWYKRGLRLNRKKKSQACKEI